MEKTANIPKSWILLYMCSTVSISNNINLGPNVRDCQPDQVLPAITNGGSQFYQQIADLIMLPVTVHIKHDSMASILLFEDVSPISRTMIMTETEKYQAIVVHLKPGEILKCIACSNGLYFYEPDNVNISTKTKNTINAYTALQTVSYNKEYSTVSKIESEKSRTSQEFVFFR